MTATAPATIPALPYDIHAEILEWVYCISQAHEVDYATFAACALVCRTWTQPAQRLLFRRVPKTTGTPRRFSVYDARLIETVRWKPWLGSYVRSFAIDDLYEDSATLLALFPNLVNLTIMTPITGARLPWSNCAMERLRALQLPIKCLDMRRTTSASFIGALLALWPGVRHVGIPKLLRAPPSQLARLFEHDEIIRVTSWVPRKEPHKMFGGEQLPDVPDLVEIELQWKEHLFVETARDLEPQNFKAVGCRSFAHIFNAMDGAQKHLSSLEEVVCTELPNVPISLPRRIRHVGYHAPTDPCSESRYESDVSLKYLVDALRELPDLRLVTATTNSSRDVLSVLENACRSVGAQFAVYPDDESVPRTRHVDWI
ncbi:hypothetical protein FA95DRAFT_1035801 [Auriscalpium vulgare]|uniref:Uncharacterized protein n=1 Tax=Auriscalpium vulgare TaxID=40419 RepID=A0ACB8R5I7_9AGAM|nr:hypothetical protein FA95DRAFT_1035801 [Auriscalpium vulgare]